MNRARYRVVVTKEYEMANGSWGMPQTIRTTQIAENDEDCSHKSLYEYLWDCFMDSIDGEKKE